MVSCLNICTRTCIYSSLIKIRFKTQCTHAQKHTADTITLVASRRPQHATDTHNRYKVSIPKIKFSFTGTGDLVSYMCLHVYIHTYLPACIHGGHQALMIWPHGGPCVDMHAVWVKDSCTKLGFHSKRCMCDHEYSWCTLIMSMHRVGTHTCMHPCKWPNLHKHYANQILKFEMLTSIQDASFFTSGIANQHVLRHRCTSLWHTHAYAQLAALLLAWLHLTDDLKESIERATATVQVCVCVCTTSTCVRCLHQLPRSRFWHAIWRIYLKNALTDGAHLHNEAYYLCSWTFVCTCVRACVRIYAYLPPSTFRFVYHATHSRQLQLAWNHATPHALVTHPHAHTCS